MPFHAHVSWLLTAVRAASSQRRRLLYAGGGLLLVLLLAAQGALEQASFSSSETPPGTIADSSGALPDYGTFAAPPAENAWWVIITGLALKLVVVLLLIYATIWLLRRYLRPASDAPTVGTGLRVLQTTALGQHQHVHLVAVGDRVLVVGATPQQLTLLTEITDSSAAAELLTEADQTSRAPSRAFGEYLADALPAEPLGGTRPPDAASGAATTVDSSAASPSSAVPTHDSPGELRQALRDAQAALHLQTDRLRRR